MTVPTDFSYTRYLAAKKSVDDRALNRRVFEAMAQALRSPQKAGPLEFLEVGCGIGTMVERLWDEGVLIKAGYTAIDLEPENIAGAASRLTVFARERDLQVDKREEREFQFINPQRSLTVSLEAVDLFNFAAREAGQVAWDVLIAHAFLDLVDLESAVPRLLALLKPGGWFYLTLNFDGATIFLPTLDPDLDALMERLYHGTMDDRRHGGRPSGSSRTGRLLFGVLPRCGGRIVAAGSSDWVVFPGPQGYPDDEAYFLHYIIHTVEGALRGQPLLEEKTLKDWTSRRHQQIERGELAYVAHQLDFFGVKES
ncbi:MAG: class I SAM-dependent methyltransferase [Syntrophobacterales bacterium]|jgi:SAM-dependent methyltransferase